MMPLHFLYMAKLARDHIFKHFGWRQQLEKKDTPSKSSQ